MSQAAASLYFLQYTSVLASVYTMLQEGRDCQIKNTWERKSQDNIKQCLCSVEWKRIWDPQTPFFSVGRMRSLYREHNNHSCINNYTHTLLQKQQDKNKANKPKESKMLLANEQFTTLLQAGRSWGPASLQVGGEGGVPGYLSRLSLPPLVEAKGEPGLESSGSVLMAGERQ